MHLQRFLIASFVLMTSCLLQLRAADDPAVWNAEQLKTQILQNSSDSIYILNFWATWCKPCVEELPGYVRLDSIIKARHLPVRLLLVSLDFRKDLQTRLKPFVAKHLSTSEVVLFSDSDMNTWIDSISPNWSGALPATLMIQPSKERKEFYERQFSTDELEQTVFQFLKL